MTPWANSSSFPEQHYFFRVCVALGFIAEAVARRERERERKTNRDRERGGKRENFGFETIWLARQGKYRADLQKAPERTGMPLQQFSLVAWDRRRQGGQAATYVGPDSSISTLRVNLWCTQRDADCLFDWCHWFSRRSKPGPKSGLTAETPYPTFIPSKGRAKSAHLNWSAPHCFGKELFEGMPEAAESPNALVVAVVEPAEAAAYRDAWPDVPLFVLPENDMGPSFARWAVQKLCTAFRTEEMEDLGPLHHLPFCWLVDDSITSFYSLEKLSSKSLAEEQGRLQERGAIVASSPLSRPSGRRTERCAQGAMFAKAFLTLQRQAASASYAVAGFLRDDGTAPMKCAQWALDNTSVFKVVLLNLEHLWELRVEYIPQLRLFEDVCLNVQARNSGGHILKCQTFCYRADNKTYGGCSDLRAAKAAANHCISSRSLVESFIPRAVLPSKKQSRCKVSRCLLLQGISRLSSGRRLFLSTRTMWNLYAVSTWQELSRVPCRPSQVQVHAGWRKTDVLRES